MVTKELLSHIHAIAKLIPDEGAISIEKESCGCDMRIIAMMCMMFKNLSNEEKKVFIDKILQYDI